jgi:hypothetical protein
MIHRIDRVNPDVDDRVIKPNEARMATNLRFGASTEDTNLSGGTLVLGNKELSFTPPSGVNKVVGVYADLETNCVFFAMYNSEQKHGLYRINGATNVVDTILGVDVLGNNNGVLLNFQPADTYNVSIAVIQGLLYWTDNVNEPGVINIEKGIRTMKNAPLPGDASSIYYSEFARTNYLQVKRPPAAVLDVYRIAGSGNLLSSIRFSPSQIQNIYTNDTDADGSRLATWRRDFVNTDGIQFSYYYVYDNNEESKLAPWSQPVFYKKRIVVQAPPIEINNFLAVNTAPGTPFRPSTVKKVVFVYRVNNDGVPFIMGSVDNTQANYSLPTNQPNVSSNPLTASTNFTGVIDLNIRSLKMFAADTTALIRTPVSTDLVEQRFDSVPLRSATNTIAQNRLNHANYILDRNSWQGMTLSLQVVSVTAPSTTSQIINETTLEGIFRPGGTYEIGIELLDVAGRPIGVIENQEITIPEMRVRNNPFAFIERSDVEGNYDIYKVNGTQVRNPLPDFNKENYDDASLNIYKVRYTVSGTLPPWAESFRIVSSGDKTVELFHRAQTTILYWYEGDDGKDIALMFPFFAGQRNTFINQGNIYWPHFFTNFPLPSTVVEYRGSGIVNGQNAPTVGPSLKFKGYAINKASVPVVYNEGDELYVKLGQQVFLQKVTPSSLSDAAMTAAFAVPIASRTSTVESYKVVKENNGLFYIENTNTGLYPVLLASDWAVPNEGGYSGFRSRNYWWDLNPWYDNFRPVLYDVEVYLKKNPAETIFYQNNTIIQRSQLPSSGSIQGDVNGDCYLCSFVQSISPYSGPTATTTYIMAVNNDPSQYFNKFLPQSSAWYSIRTPRWLTRLNIPGAFYSMNPNSYSAENWTWQKGQPAIVNENQREVIIDNGIIFSSPFVQGTQINGLNQFNSLDFRLAPVENGPISSLVVTNATQKEPGVMLAIGANGVSSFYYDAIQLSNVDGTDNVATTTSYLASQRPLLGQYGTTRQMSVTKTPLGTVYWWSDNVNDLIRYTNAGLERLGMTFSFANYLRKTYNDNPLLITWYDQVTDEILLCGKLRETAVFSERYKTFQGERSYNNGFGKYPERGIGLATKQFLFLEGKIWVTDVELVGLNAPDDNFIFGEYKDPVLNIVTNESPANVKRWNQIKVFGSRPNSVELQAPDETEGVSGVLESYLDVGNWIKRKSDWEAAIRRAANTPGGILAGKLMESRIIYSKFAFSAQGFQKLNFIEVKSNVSIVQ